MFDVYTDVAFPGGVRAEPFVTFWGHVTAEQDSNRFQTTLSGIARYVYRGVPPVQGDSGPALLAQAVVEHKNNYNLAAVIAKHQFRDETSAVEAMSAYMHRDEIEASGAAIQSVTGWYDGALVNAAIKRFLTIRTPGSRLLIGPWSHQGENLSPFATKAKDFGHTAASIEFFDATLKGDSNALTHEPPVRYYTIGEERWKTAPTWPPPGTRNQIFYFTEGNRLGTARPTAADALDRHLVDLTAASGQNTRWNNLTALDVAHFITRDRAERDTKLLVYTGDPLADDLEVTGHPMITVHLSSDQPDGALFAYLEDVDVDGSVHYVTEGVLRIIDRKISPEKAPYVFPMPFRTFAKGDAMPLEPGEIAPIAFDLYPISYLFRRGHRVRVALAGADRDHFAQISATPPTWQVHRDTAHPSAIELPVMPR
jgi:putative CocE/NonD family hydrolase